VSLLFQRRAERGHCPATEDDMKPTMLFGVVVLSLAGFLAQDQPPRDESYEGLVKDMLGTVETITKILKTIRDRDTADAARPDLKKAAEIMLGLRKKAEDFQQPSKEEKDRLEKLYAPKLKVAVEQLRETTVIVKGVPGGEAAVAELGILKDKQEKQK